MIAPPSPEAQLAFLTKLQRLFAEGDFTATYKFALMVALADLAVEHGHDDGERLQLSVRQIADKFVGLYWQQSTPYRSGQPATRAGVLVQNIGEQARVIQAIARFRTEHRASTIQSARTLPAYRELLSEVSATVSAQPLKYLQNLGGQTDPFLYVRQRGSIALEPGVTYCLRRFQPLVQQLARTHWIDHIKSNRRNDPFLGEAGDLEQFLFESSRQTLGVVSAELQKLMGRRCFYCGAAVADADVDHFVPFSLYPRDLIHNFVLAHPACNRSKSDALAAKPHLERWVVYMQANADSLAEIGTRAGVLSDADASKAVAIWGYGNGLSGGSSAWVKSRIFEPIDASYMECFA